MGISDLLSSKAAEFVSLWDVVVGLSIKEDISESRAALGLIALLDDEQEIKMGWGYFYRDEDTLITIDHCNHEYGLSHEYFCLERLREIATAEIIENSMSESLLCHTGWDKSELSEIFERRLLEPLDCFGDTHVSSITILATSSPDEPTKSTPAINWKHYARRPYLNEYECACLIEGVDPSLYTIIRYDDVGEEISRKHKISGSKLARVELAHSVIERSTNMGLKSLTNSRDWNNNFFAFFYLTSTFIDWVKQNNYELNEEFTAEYERINNIGDTVSFARLDVPQYLDTNHPCYSPRLAATINAWKVAVGQWGLNKKTPKQHMEKWLRDNSESFTFELSEAGRKSITSIANFRDGSSISTEEMNEAKQAIEEYEKFTAEAKSKEHRFDLDFPF